MHAVQVSFSIVRHLPVFLLLQEIRGRLVMVLPIAVMEIKTRLKATAVCLID